MNRVLIQSATVSLVLMAAALAKAADSTPSAEPLPKILQLTAQPAALTLIDGRDERRVLVLGKAEGDKWFDLSSIAVFKPASPIVEIADKGYVKPKSKGKTDVTISAAGHTIKVPVTVENASSPPVRFVRDIEPVISKAGCNQGTCHGSAKGKNGFKLSLRGYDPDYDYGALINDISGRRYDRAAVDENFTGRISACDDRVVGGVTEFSEETFGKY